MAAELASTITWWAIVSAFGGTVIGSVLGGFISYLLQRKSLAATKALSDADRKEVRKALGYAIFFKMIRLCSDLTQLGTPISKAILNAQQQGQRRELWFCDARPSSVRAYKVLAGGNGSRPFA
jgi:hypothetical protein